MLIKKDYKITVKNQEITYMTNNILQFMLTNKGTIFHGHIKKWQFYAQKIRILYFMNMIKSGNLMLKK